MKKRMICLTILVSMFLAIMPVGAAEKNISLPESIDLALHNNLGLELSKRNINIATSQVDIAKAAKTNPSLDLTNSYTRFNQSQQGTNSENLFNTKIGFSYPLYLYSGGKLQAAEKTQQFNLEASRSGYEVTRQQLVYKVKEAYYGVLKAQHMVNVAEENQSGMQSHFKVAEAMFKTGMAPKFDVLRAEVGVLDAKQQVIKAKNGVDIAKATFNNVLNRDLSSSVNLIDIMEVTPEADKFTINQLVDKAYNLRPELQQLDATLKAAEENIKYVKADKKPDLALTGNYQWKGSEFVPSKNSWDVSLVSTFNLWDGGIINNQVKQAEEKAAQAQIQVDQARQDIALEVRQAYLNIQEAKEALATAKKTVEQAKEGLKIAEVRYKAGMGTSVERLDAQLALTQAETNYVQALYSYNLAKAQLEKATGEDKK